MIELEQYKYEWSQYKDKIKELADSFHIEMKQSKIKEIEEIMEHPDFWDDVTKSTEIMQELKSLKSSLDIIQNLQNRYEDLGILIEMGDEEEDSGIIEEVESELKRV